MTAQQRRIALVLATLAILTLVRLVVAAEAPLAPDEAYYWVFSRALAAGFPDHPPMVALWIRAGTALAGDGALGVRLLGPLAGALGSVLLFDAAARLIPERGAGLAAAAMFNGTLMAGAGAVIMTPDTPLLFFWTACLWALARLVHDGRPGWWLAIGLFAGLALASKYTALLLWIGIGLWLLVVPSARRWWRSPTMWTGAAIGALVFLPVVLWNASHEWASFVRQGGRVGDWHPARAVQFLGELVGGQIGLATPLLFALFVAGVVAAARRAWHDRDPACALLVALTVPGAALFAQHALGDRVQGNWPAILYPAGAIAAARLTGPRWLRLRWPAVALGLAVTFLVYAQASSFALPLGERDPVTRQLAGWDVLAASVDAARRQENLHCVASDEYGTAAVLARALPAGVVVLGVDPRWLLVPLRAADEQDGAACLLLRHSGGRPPTGWGEARVIGEALRPGGGGTVQRFELWRVAGAQPSLPVFVLPRPAVR